MNSRNSANRSGYTLAEALVTLMIFASISGLAFLTFFRSTLFFQRSIVRQQLQSELTRFDVLFERDAVLTDHTLCYSEDRVLPIGVRDGLSMASVTDWYDPAYFDPTTQLPIWNEYIVYYATRGDEGKLYRQRVAPTAVPPNGFNVPYVTMLANMNDVSPQLNANVVKTTLVSEHVASFDVRLRAMGDIEVNLRLHRRGAGKVSGQRTETLESNFLVKPWNTWPEI